MIKQTTRITDPITEAAVRRIDNNAAALEQRVDTVEETAGLVLSVPAYINQLTGDVLAGPGSGSQAATLNMTLDTIPAPVASVNFADQQALSFRIENRTSDPASPAVGQIWLRTNL